MGTWLLGSGGGGRGELRGVSAPASQRGAEDAGLGRLRPQRGWQGEMTQSGTCIKHMVQAEFAEPTFQAAGRRGRGTQQLSVGRSPHVAGGVTQGPLGGQEEGPAVPGTLRPGLASEGCSRESVLGSVAAHVVSKLQAWWVLCGALGGLPGGQQGGPGWAAVTRGRGALGPISPCPRVLSHRQGPDPAPWMNWRLKATPTVTPSQRAPRRALQPPDAEAGPPFPLSVSILRNEGLTRRAASPKGHLFGGG